jgi:hypothetical protein
MIPCRLSIYIKGKNTPQGKVFIKDGKWIYLANITSNKYWRNYSGYSIATQLLEAFSKAKIRPLIIYRITDKNLAWSATPTTFLKKGIPVTYDHRQQVLPIKKWKAYRERLDEPFNLPDLTVDEWVKSDPVEYHNATMDEYLESRERLNDIRLKLGII